MFLVKLELAELSRIGPNVLIYFYMETHRRIGTPVDTVAGGSARWGGALVGGGTVTREALLYGSSDMVGHYVQTRINFCVLSLEC